MAARIPVKLPAPTSAPSSASHRITFLPGGRAVHAAHDESILDAALRQGLSLPYGCRDGACRSCAAPED